MLRTEFAPASMSRPANASRPAAAATHTSAMTISTGRNRTPYILVSAMALSFGPGTIVRYVAHLSDHTVPGAYEAAACKNSGLSSSVRRLNTGQLSVPRRNAPAR